MARNNCIRVVSTFLDVLKIADVDDKVKNDILQPLLTAVEKSKPEAKQADQPSDQPTEQKGAARLSPRTPVGKNDS